MFRSSTDKSQQQPFFFSSKPVLLSPLIKAGLLSEERITKLSPQEFYSLHYTKELITENYLCLEQALKLTTKQSLFLNKLSLLIQERHITIQEVLELNQEKFELLYGTQQIVLYGFMTAQDILSLKSDMHFILSQEKTIDLFKSDELTSKQVKGYTKEGLERYVVKRFLFTKGLIIANPSELTEKHCYYFLHEDLRIIPLIQNKVLNISELDKMSAEEISLRIAQTTEQMRQYQP